MTVSIFAQIKRGETTRFKEKDGLLYYDERLYVPRTSQLRKELLKECHDSVWAGHPGQHRTRALVEKSFYWKHLHVDIEEYVCTCLICQQDKSRSQKKAGLLHPLSITERPWVSVSMEFITQLPKAQGFNGIFMVVDRFSKYATFMPMKLQCKATDVAKLFFRHVVKY